MTDLTLLYLEREELRSQRNCIQAEINMIEEDKKTDGIGMMEMIALAGATVKYETYTSKIDEISEKITKLERKLNADG